MYIYTYVYIHTHNAVGPAVASAGVDIARMEQVEDFRDCLPITRTRSVCQCITALLTNFKGGLPLPMTLQCLCC